ncbi:SMI1/KNR4 family protein [Actinocorallia sp. B10E7]|uniref:SMI1/KNR4 family protein n=1 Tax=Actinocorallia sp. B10E7 TaxID=3153558 RepID=UPI00325C3FAD
MTLASVEESWTRLECWLEANAPGNFARLNPPAEPAVIAAAEEALGREFPEDLRRILLLRNGTNEHDQSGKYHHGAGFLPEFTALLPAERIAGIHAMRVEIMQGLMEDEEEFEEWALGNWWHPGWLPIADASTADGLFIDQRGGTDHGSVGHFVHDDSARLNLWPSLAAMLHDVADAVEGVRDVPSLQPSVWEGQFLEWR